MSEPTLESISDYDTLKGEKKRVVWAVVLSGLVMGAIYTFASAVINHEKVTPKEKINTIPMR